MNKTESLFQIADELLAAAEYEQERAEEDAVTHRICVHSRQAISNLLAGYLLQKNTPIEHPVSIESLQKQCESIDARFEQLDLSPLSCRLDQRDMNYCLEFEKVNACLKTAQHVRAIIITETPGY
jgi:hypothetical protein